MECTLSRIGPLYHPTRTQEAGIILGRPLEPMFPEGHREDIMQPVMIIRATMGTHQADSTPRLHMQVLDRVHRVADAQTSHHLLSLERLILGG